MSVLAVRQDPESVTAPPQKPAALRLVPDSDHVSLKTWIAVIGANLGAFMAVLNIQIVNSSLADIQGAIGAGSDDGGWISTAYLVAEIITIPLTAWFSRVFSVRNYLLVSATMFLVFSAACAFAGNLQGMIVMRAAQGFFGGVMIPLALTIILTMLPRSKQPVGMALFALSATFGPAIGPTIGGYLTDQLGWQYIFFVNLIPGILMLGMLYATLERAPMNLSLLKEGDWSGIATMAVGLGTLQTVLEEGEKDGWFGSDFIVRLAAVSALALSAFIIIQFTTKKPLLNLRLLARRSFGLGTLVQFLLGIVLYGSVYVLPIYLGRMQGYNAYQIGAVLAWTGLPQLLIIPFAPAMMEHIDARLLLTGGFVIFASSFFLTTGLSHDFSGHQFIVTNIIRAIGQALIFPPLNALTTGGIEKENAPSASAISNMMRNLGGAIGIAMLQTFLTQREQFHSSMLNPSVSLFSEATRARIAGLTQHFLASGITDPAQATHQAVVAIGRIVTQQSYFLAFGDTFFLMGGTLLAATVAVLAMKKLEGAPTGGGGH